MSAGWPWWHISWWWAPILFGAGITCGLMAHLAWQWRKDRRH